MSEGKSNGVRREWRVLYQAASGDAGAPLLTIDVVALTDAAARSKVEASGARVIDVEEIRPIIDWSKPWLTMEEIALRYGKQPRTISRWIELGILPRCNGGTNLWNVETADRAAAKSVGLKFTPEGELKAA